MNRQIMRRAAEPGPPSFGIEEEIFVTHPERPSLEALYYLAKLLWRNPRYYYSHSDSNFARGSDVKYGLMGGIEYSTGCHFETGRLIEDLAERRAEFASACGGGLLVAIGHLADMSASTLTCGMHIHVGNLTNPENTYAGFVHFLPLLAVMTANAPFISGRYFGQSSRMANSYAIGPLRDDPWYRFQDIIFARRLGTIEIRVFDPVWDLERIKALANCLAAISRDSREYKLDRVTYNRLRERFVIEGYTEEMKDLYRELSELIDLPESLFERTPSDEFREIYQAYGLVPAYSALDNAYRNNILQVREIPEFRRTIAKAAVGLASYYIVRLPYKLQKVLKEW